MAAAYVRCNEKRVKLMMEAGAKIETVDKEGQTPLLVAAFVSRNEKKVKLLIEAGEKIGAVDKRG